MKRNLWLDNKKEEIIKLHTEFNMSQKEIALYFNTSITSIGTRLRAWGYNNTDGNRYRRVDLGEDTIKKLYWDFELSPTVIALKYNCTSQTIINGMRRFNIPLRTKSQAKFVSASINCKDSFKKFSYTDITISIN